MTDPAQFPHNLRECDRARLGAGPRLPRVLPLGQLFGRRLPSPSPIVVVTAEITYAMLIISPAPAVDPLDALLGKFLDVWYAVENGRARRRRARH